MVDLLIEQRSLVELSVAAGEVAVVGIEDDERLIANAEIVKGLQQLGEERIQEADVAKILGDGRLPILPGEVLHAPVMLMPDVCTCGLFSSVS